MNTCPPILTAEQAGKLEEQLLSGEEAVWSVMCRAGDAVAEAVKRDAQEGGGLPSGLRVLVLVGKGHNAGDALITARRLLEQDVSASADLLLAFPEERMRPLAKRALDALEQRCDGRVQRLSISRGEKPGVYDLSLDGLVGMRVRLPLEPALSAVLSWERACSVGMRVAMDLPSGLAEQGAYQADFTYATGIVKSALLCCSNAGRIRYVDLGFFDKALINSGETLNRVMVPRLLSPLWRFRPPTSDKRSFGHVHVLAGSRHFPGAALMAVLGALHSGAGLVTGYVPESLVPAFAARAPEAMWVGLPETPEGGIALEARGLIQHRLDRGSSLVMGPGLGREAETLALVEGLLTSVHVPVVLDADALTPKIVKAGWAPRILTPHAGEFLRLAGGIDPERFSAEVTGVLVLKGPITRVVWHGQSHYSFCGGPVLARGGSGDLLAGLMGGLLAQNPIDPQLAALRAVLWQGMAADLMARDLGAVSATTTRLLEYLPKALRHACSLR